VDRKHLMAEFEKLGNQKRDARSPLLHFALMFFPVIVWASGRPHMVSFTLTRLNSIFQSRYAPYYLMSHCPLSKRRLGPTMEQGSFNSPNSVMPSTSPKSYRCQHQSGYWPPSQQSQQGVSLDHVLTVGYQASRFGIQLMVLSGMVTTSFVLQGCSLEVGS